MSQRVAVQSIIGVNPPALPEANDHSGLRCGRHRHGSASFFDLNPVAVALRGALHLVFAVVLGGSKSPSYRERRVVYME